MAKIWIPKGSFWANDLFDADGNVSGATIHYYDTEGYGIAQYFEVLSPQTFRQGELD